MSGGRDPPRQRQLGPAKPLDRLDVPRFLLERQLRLQDDHVLRPANGHIPMDSAHLVEVFKIFSTHMDQMEVVNNKAYTRIIDRLKEVATL